MNKIISFNWKEWWHEKKKAFCLIHLTNGESVKKRVVDAVIACHYKDLEIFQDIRRQWKFLHPTNLVSRAHVTLVLRNGKTTSGIMYFSSTFHWPNTEHTQSYRKFVNTNFAPRSPILIRTIASGANMAFKTPAKSLSKPLNQQHVLRCINFRFASNLINFFGAKSNSKNTIVSK